MGPAYEQRFCWNQNALLKKIDFGNHGEITISWMVKPVTAIRPHPLRIAARCCSFVSRTRYPSRHCDIVGGLFPSACGIAKAGERSPHSIKIKAGGDPCKENPRSIIFCVRNASP